MRSAQQIFYELAKLCASPKHAGRCLSLLARQHNPIFMRDEGRGHAAPLLKEPPHLHRDIYLDRLT